MEFLVHIPALLALLIGLALLVGGGELLVRGAAALAFKANIPPLIIRLTTVSMGTTATITPLPMEASVLSWDIWWLLGTACALIPLALLGGLKVPRMGRWQGGLFVLAYVAYIALTWTA